jgi:signal transduction histidine kinase/phage shock protein PspC (stress-responsive transcriptional regulator)
MAEQIRTKRRWRRGSWRRVPEQRLLGGVAAGISARTGVDVTVVRTLFVVTAFAGGFGIACYLAAWLLVPATGESSSIGSKALGDRTGITLAAGLASLVTAVFVLMSLVGAGWIGSLAWSFVLSVIGVVLIARNAPPGEQATLRRLADPVIGFTGDTTRSRIALRALVAGALLVAGVVTLLVGHTSTALLRPLAGLALVVAAIVLVFGPWWLRVGRELVAERQARVRAEERADIASRVHDSVLQTLALIQRRATEPQQVIQLARAQERELRSWLFDGRAPGSMTADTTFAAGVRLIQSDVEAQHGVTVEVVTVGDCPIDDDVQALLGAAREATVNAAKWSGVQVISIYAEVEPEAVSLFVRDRGKGFDPATIPADRKGLSDSIHARMVRHGGSADVRSAPGEGTEIRLALPRVAVGESAPA